jgi:hypothetical protein
MIKEIVIDPVIVMGTLFTIVGTGVAWLFIRMDQQMDNLRKEIIRMEKEIGALQNADVSCTRDQTILKTEMSSLREAMLRFVTNFGRVVKDGGQ